MAISWSCDACWDAVGVHGQEGLRGCWGGVRCYLDLSDNHIGAAEGAGKLAEALRSWRGCKALAHLDLSGNAICADTTILVVLVLRE
eukprot:2097954-Rhodomonas_salina.1